jgi:quercetin dioxygenase-like cupin family protein
MQTPDVLNGAVAPGAMQRLHEAMLRMPQVDIHTTHTFGPGLYVRTILIPAGVTLVGKTHRTEHVFMVLKGDITLVTDEGRIRVQAPFQCVSKPGVKRAGYAHSETVCANVHITNETDLVKLEAQLIQLDSLPGPNHKEIEL